MNNYPDFINFDYTKSYPNEFDMNMYNKDKINNYNSYKEDKSNKLYDSYNGLIRGNLFKNLYVPYESKEPYEIRPMNEQAKMLTNIDALKFAMIDLNLYLDINPDDKELINLFNKYRKEHEDLMKQYENMYGPITLNSDSLNTYPWSWINMPWPWEN